MEAEAETEKKPDLPPKPRKMIKRRRKRRVVKPKVQKSEFAGMTAADCATACCQERCVITDYPLCGHPRKGGLQSAFMSKPDVLARYQRAVKYLQHAEVDRRET